MRHSALTRISGRQALPIDLAIDSQSFSCGTTSHYAREAQFVSQPKNIREGLVHKCTWMPFQSHLSHSRQGHTTNIVDTSRESFVGYTIEGLRKILL